MIINYLTQNAYETHINYKLHIDGLYVVALFLLETDLRSI